MRELWGCVSCLKQKIASFGQPWGRNVKQKVCRICSVVQTTGNTGVRKYNKKGLPVYQSYCHDCEADRALARYLMKLGVDALFQKRRRTQSLLSLIEEELACRAANKPISNGE